MYDIDKFLGDKTKNVIKMISAVLLIDNENIFKFSASMIAKKTGLSTQEMGGGWTSLTMQTNNMPPLLLKAGKVLERDVKGKRSYTPLWRINKEVDWKEIEKQIKKYL
ncbi:MAG: hypothetical protein RBT33_02795 [Candidatus Dojkabacteria bacterium]|jgi:hypothetical protein|nr:hypothetical protein [Candidatus Dojkabacteria bacterium]